MTLALPARLAADRAIGLAGSLVFEMPLMAGQVSKQLGQVGL